MLKMLSKGFKKEKEKAILGRERVKYKGGSDEGNEREGRTKREVVQ